MTTATTSSMMTIAITITRRPTTTSAATTTTTMTTMRARQTAIATEPTAPLELRLATTRERATAQFRRAQGPTTQPTRAATSTTHTSNNNSNSSSLRPSLSPKLSLLTLRLLTTVFPSQPTSQALTSEALITPRAPTRTLKLQAACCRINSNRCSAARPLLTVT